MELYAHVRSPIETRRKMLEMNMKESELKRAFNEYFLAKNGDSATSMQIMDSLWSVVETVLKVSVANAYLLEEESGIYIACFGCLERLQRLIPEQKNE